MVARALRLTSLAGNVSIEGVAAAVAGRHVLVVLDNCEHLIDAAAHMAEALLRASPVVCVVTTSREPLRASAEHVYRVPPLDVPAEDNLDADDVLRHGAVKLFVARAQAVEPRYVPDRRLASATAAICRHLDGIPLAIELAAARISAFGVEGVASRLDDRFRLLTGGSRTALPRQQTLRATLDWSHELVSTPSASSCGAFLSWREVSRSPRSPRLQRTESSATATSVNAWRTSSQSRSFRSI